MKKITTALVLALAIAGVANASPNLQQQNLLKDPLYCGAFAINASLTFLGRRTSLPETRRFAVKHRLNTKQWNHKEINSYANNKGCTTRIVRAPKRLRVGDIVLGKTPIPWIGHWKTVYIANPSNLVIWTSLGGYERMTNPRMTYRTVIRVSCK